MTQLYQISLQMTASVAGSLIGVSSGQLKQHRGLIHHEASIDPGEWHGPGYGCWSFFKFSISFNFKEVRKASAVLTKKCF